MLRHTGEPLQLMRPVVGVNRRPAPSPRWDRADSAGDRRMADPAPRETMRYTARAGSLASSSARICAAVGQRSRSCLFSRPGGVGALDGSARPFAGHHNDAALASRPRPTRETDVDGIDKKGSRLIGLTVSCLVDEQTPRNYVGTARRRADRPNRSGRQALRGGRRRLANSGRRNNEWRE